MNLRRAGARHIVEALALSLLSTFAVVAPTASAAGGSEALAITGFSPAVSLRGGTLTIEGTGFAPAVAGNSVTVNGATATVTAASDTALSVKVPSMATSGPVVVTTAEGTTESATDATVAPSGYTAAQTHEAVRITAGEPLVAEVPIAGHIATFTLALEAGDRFALRLRDSTFGTTTTKAQVRVLKPDGNVLVSGTGFATAGVWIDTKVAPATGTYNILVYPLGTAVGQVEVDVVAVAADAEVSAVPGGEAVVVSTTSRGQRGSVPVKGNAGDRVAFTVASVSMSGTGTTQVQVLGPDGSTVAGTSTSFGTAGGFIDAVTLPTTGTYRLILDPPGEQVGDATVTVHAVPSGSTDHAPTDGTPVSVSANVPGENPSVAFAHDGGKFAVWLTASTFGASSSNAKVSVVTASGTVVTSATGFTTSGVFLDAKSWTTEEDLRVVVDPQGARTGEVQVRVWALPNDLEGTIAQDGTPETVTTTVPGQNGALTFDGTAGQRVSLMGQAAPESVRS